MVDCSKPRTLVTTLLMASLFIVQQSTDATAQTRRTNPRYQPSKPTVSPYLDLLRESRGGVPNYYTFVRPKQEIASQERQFADALQRQQATIQTLTQAAQQSAGQVTGTGSTFRNLSHFYPQRQSTRRR